MEGLSPQPWPRARVTINVSVSLLWKIISKVSPLFIGGNGIWKLKQDVLLAGLDSQPFPCPPPWAPFFLYTPTPTPTPSTSAPFSPRKIA